MASQIHDCDMPEALGLKLPSTASLTIADDITAMILTLNEAPNIARTLKAISWVKEILIIDSGSTDETLSIISGYANARVIIRKFDSFAEQCNFGLSKVRTGWVLSLDADYELTSAMSAEIRALVPKQAVSGYRAGFIYRMYGRALCATLYPPRTVLYRPSCGRYRNEGHGHRVIIEGEVCSLTSAIFHDDRKPLARWISSQQGYARCEADYLLVTPQAELKFTDRIRLMGWSAPVLVFFYTLLWNRCIFDGWPGWLYVLQRTFAETIIAIELVDRRLRGKRTPPP